MSSSVKIDLHFRDGCLSSITASGMAAEHERFGRHAPLQRPVLGPYPHALEAGVDVRLWLNSRKGPSMTGSARHSIDPGGGGTWEHLQRPHT